MIAEIQCLPEPAGTPTEPYGHIDAAIAAVAASGLTYEVGALGTTVEGPAEAVWAVLRRAHEASLLAGAHRVVTVMKVVDTTDEHPPSIADLVGGHR